MGSKSIMDADPLERMLWLEVFRPIFDAFKSSDRLRDRAPVLLFDGRHYDLGYLDSDQKFRSLGFMDDIRSAVIEAVAKVKSLEPVSTAEAQARFTERTGSPLAKDMDMDKYAEEVEK